MLDHLGLGDLDSLRWHLKQGDKLVVVFALKQKLALEVDVAVFARLDENVKHSVGDYRVDL